MSIAIRGLLAMGENRNRRGGFSVMSYPRYTNCRTWWRSWPEARKFGGCYVFGIQSYAQLEDIYGEMPRCLTS
ncbi:type IV secretion system DNA-binding domain-containing protein [Escherichia coli]|uniref:type IV secretion system DNA-binding domain-containing protein n=1 Tax=Escherichia coli TaxID=562 RepID=UPI00320789DE